MSLEDELNGIGDYYDGHPEPPEEPVSDEAQAEYDAAMADWEADFGEGGPPDPPEPPEIPGPPAPGAGMPAARATDMTAHGGTIGPVVTGISAKVFIGFLPAACMGDPQICPMFDGPKPHVGGTIVKGSSSVNIGGKPAARVSDTTECKGPPGSVALGEFTVMIGG